MEWAIWLTVALTLLIIPWTRRAAYLILIAAPLAVLALLLWSEPDLTD